MKLLSALLMTTLMSLAALPEAYADSQPCACQCQCEAAPTTSPDGSVLAIPKPPPPVVVEAVNDELDLQTLGNADATVELTYPEINDGHTAGLYWTSAIGQYRAPVQTVSGGAKKLTFNIPNATVVRDLGQSPVLTASVGVGNDSLVISQPRTIKVISGATPGQYPAATLPDFPDNLVDIGTLADDLKVRVAYDIQGPGQGVKVLWRGATSYDSPMRFPTDNTPLLFTIPHATVIASVGKPVALTYEVALDGQPAQPSDRLAPAIVLRTLKEVPVVPQAVQGQIDLKDLLAKPLRVTYTYSGITPGHTAGIRWAGNPEYDTPHPTIGTTPRPLEFTIPYDKVRLERDKTVAVTASVGTGDGHLAVSPALSLEIVDTRPKGEEIADELNRRYTQTPVSCPDGKPSYYCSGVTLRGTTNGNFDPWDPSPNALRKGSQSFTYMRLDTRITALYRNSGFIFLAPQQWSDKNQKPEYLCSFPHDAWTDQVGRPAKGCGSLTRDSQPLLDLLIRNPELANLIKNDDPIIERLRTSQNPGGLFADDQKLAALLNDNPDLGRLLREDTERVEGWKLAPNLVDLSTCSSKNAITLATWRAFTGALSHPSTQCSLSTQSPSQFDVSVKARQHTIPAVQSTYNELLLSVWPVGVGAQLPMQAFFYNTPTGLPEAKAYQQKYAARTGGLWLPVIKLDMTKVNSNPFSYSAADQAVQQP